MASFGTVSKGIAVVGISPRQEADKSNLPVRIVEGNYLKENDNGILIGEGLKKYLKANLGDTLAFIGQGYHGVSAAGLFPVRGILKMSTEEFDNGLAYTSLQSAQQFIGMPDGYSGILIAVGDNKKLDATIELVRQNVDAATLDVYSWHFTMERFLQQQESDKAFTKMLLFILYLIVGFGILGTVIMLTNERKREFGMMISLGMQRSRLAVVVAIEMLIMSLFGILAAFAITLPTAFYFNIHPIEITGDMAKMYTDMGMEPIMPTSVEPSIFIIQMSIVFALTLLATIYPVSKIMKLKLMNRQ
jgi:ABC-type lipoprotein release transport system permease subunit